MKGLTSRVVPGNANKSLILDYVTDYLQDTILGQMDNDTNSTARSLRTEIEKI
jgi:hypothetical protein